MPLIRSLVAKKSMTVKQCDSTMAKPAQLARRAYLGTLRVNIQLKAMAELSVVW